MSNSVWDTLEDLSVDRRLLPSKWRGGDNARRIRHCKIALRHAMESCISQAQRQQLELYYGRSVSKSEIARLQGVTCSAVTKSLRACRAQVREYVALYMRIYDSVERDLLSEDD